MTDTTPPTVRRVGEWHLVTAAQWQISVGPDGLIQLPKHLHPRDAADFVAAITTASDVGNNIISGNIEAASNDDRALAQRNAIITQGPPPAGTVRMNVAQRQSELATIGRPTRRGRGATTAQPAQTAQPLLTRQERAARARKASSDTQAATGAPDG